MATKMQLKEGDTVPNVVFKARVRDEKIGGPNPFTWKDVSSADLFKGKRAVIFSLPGAFTPTCSSTHLPGYEKAYEEIKACGVDDIYCLSVNDAFVMRQWGLHQGLPEEKTSTANPLNPGNFQKVKLLPDGACLFTRGMGMSSVWDSERGFGERSWRYSAVFNDMKIEKLFVEVNAAASAAVPIPPPSSSFEFSHTSPQLHLLSHRAHTYQFHPSLLTASSAGRRRRPELGPGPLRGLRRHHHAQLPQEQEVNGPASPLPLAPPAPARLCPGGHWSSPSQPSPSRGAGTPARSRRCGVII
jgi:peroxiredoxin